MKSYGIDKIQEVLSNTHPKQIINKVGEFKLMMFEVKYEYITNRNNKKTGTKYMLLNKLNPQADLELELTEWVNQYNKENEHRPISNVKFLEGKCLGYINI